MKFLLPLLSCLMLTGSVGAESARFYLGTYTHPPAGGQGIYTATLDTESGAIGPVTLAAKAENPSWVALSPDGKHAYAAQEGKEGMVAAYAINGDKSPSFTNSQLAQGMATCHVSVDPLGRFVFAANYSSGDVVVFPIKEDGSLGASTDFKKFVGSGPDASRQKEPHAHFIQTDPEGKFLYVCDLGTDKIWIYALDGSTGKLTPAEPAFAQVPPGGGPRHLAFHPTRDWVYVNTEMGLTVCAFSRDPKTGALTPLQEPVSTLKEGVAHPEHITTAEILCHPSGKWLYVSNRTADTVAVYSLGADGRIRFVQEVPALVKVPRGMAIDPTGKWLVTAGQNDSRLAVLKIDQGTGELTATSQTAEVPSPVSVVFAP